MSQFEISVVPDNEWVKHPGRVAVPVPEAIIEVIKAGLRDGKKRGVVIPDNEVEELVKQLQKGAKQLNCTVTKQVHRIPETPGYSKVLFKVGERIYRTRK